MGKPSRVRELYEFFEENNLPMLSNYPADFWEAYRSNHVYFDRLFMKSYREFMAFGNFGTVEENAVDWSLDIYSFLLANDKRYSELWRLQTVSDVDYSILDNYNVRETHITDNDKTAMENFGAKTETKTGSTQYGASTETNTNSYVHGAKSESDSNSTVYGSQTIQTDVDLDVGAQTNTNEDKVSADNESLYSPKDHTTTILGNRSDSTDTTEVRGSHTDTESGTHTEAAYTDSESKSRTAAAHTDTTNDSTSTGAHTDAKTYTEDETRTVTRVGNIGVYSASKLLSEHAELWTAFNFYKMIFDDIAKEFLRIVYF